MDLDFLLIFFISWYLVKRLNTKVTYPQWDLRLKWMMYLSLVLLAITLAAGKFGYVFEIISAEIPAEFFVSVVMSFIKGTSESYLSMLSISSK